jgi:hypothetical protein
MKTDSERGVHAASTQEPQKLDRFLTVSLSKIDVHFDSVHAPQALTNLRSNPVGFQN